MVPVHIFSEIKMKQLTQFNCMPTSTASEATTTLIAAAIIQDPQLAETIEASDLCP